jgi:hypothetical protein
LPHQSSGKAKPAAARAGRAKLLISHPYGRIDRRLSTKKRRFAIFIGI